MLTRQDIAIQDPPQGQGDYGAKRIYLSIQDPPNGGSLGVKGIDIALYAYLVETVTLVDQLQFLRNVTSTLQISSAELYDVKSINLYPLTFLPSSFTADETDMVFTEVQKHEIRMRFTISYTHPDSGNLITETFEDFTPNLT